jgi:hypothetical protein
MRWVRSAAVSASLIAVIAVPLSGSPTPAHASTGPTITGYAATSVPAVPDTVTRCNAAVCMTIVGSGRYVRYITAQGVSASLRGCSAGEWLVRGVLREITRVVCWNNRPGSVEILSAFFPAGYNTSGEQCVKFTGRGSPQGKPCFTIA